jgi:hypothetical protein
MGFNSAFKGLIKWHLVGLYYTNFCGYLYNLGMLAFTCCRSVAASRLVHLLSGGHIMTSTRNAEYLTLCFLPAPLPVGQYSKVNHIFHSIHDIYLLSRYALMIYVVGKASLNEHERLCKFSAMKNIESCPAKSSRRRPLPMSV